MKNKLLALLAGVAMLGFAGAANAQTPVQLSNSQLDNVTAGASAIGVGLGGALGTLFSGSSVTIFTAVVGPNASAIGDVTSIAGSCCALGAVAGSSLTLLLTSP